MLHLATDDTATSARTEYCQCPECQGEQKNIFTRNFAKFSFFSKCETSKDRFLGPTEKHYSNFKLKTSIFELPHFAGICRNIS